nr:hemerythrin domain-containing protein [Amycolatopsis iheyensis]
MLKNDHKTVEKLFKEFEKAGERAYRRKRELADSMIEELTVHAYIEEEIFYPVARAAVPETKDHVEEEEDEWFPEVRSAMGRKRLQELGQRMLDARGDAPKNPLELKSATA